MSILTLIATALGIVLSILNLVAFVREKDKAHLRISLGILLLLALALAVALLPRYAPGPARSIAERLPAHPWVQRWLSQAASGEPAPATAPLQGSFQLEPRHNLLGGLSGFLLRFSFADTGHQGARVLSYQLKIQEQQGQAFHSFQRVLPQPVSVTPGGTASLELDVEGEMVQHLFNRMDAEEPGTVEVIWTAVSADGSTFTFSAANNAMD
ncbi:MAG: hypothetical protein AB1758_21650 [Candidatus Eremiobacterota bacterium]